MLRNSLVTTRLQRGILLCTAAVGCSNAQEQENTSRRQDRLSPNFVQANSAVPQTAQTLVAQTYNRAQSAGDLNVAIVGWQDTNAQVTSVTDSKGNVYQLAIGPTLQTNRLSQSIYYANNIVAASPRSNTVSVRFSTAAKYVDLRILEYAGLDLNSPLDRAIGASGSSVTSDSGLMNTSHANDLLVAGNVVITSTASAGPNFTSRLLTRTNADIAEDRVVTNVGAYSASARLTRSGPWVMQMAAFKVTSSGGSGAGGSGGSGGVVGSGGSQSLSGTSSIGGTSPTGGNQSTGGISAAGGTLASGGSATTANSTSAGATQATGGVSAAGGSTGTPLVSGTLPANLSDASATVIFQVAGVGRTVVVYRPATLAANPPLVILYHGTGDNPQNFMDATNATSVAAQRNFVVVALAALENRRGGPDDPDHWESIAYDTGWNLSIKDAQTNEDVQFTRAIITAANAAYGIDRKRVYTMGMSNGAFFSPMVALLLPNEIAGFGENSGGAIRCANRGATGAQWMGVGLTCASLEAQANYPSCSTGLLKPVPVPSSGRVPLGYLVHYHDDDTVSVAWSCQLSDALGANATVKILSSGGHALEPNFVDNAWQVISGASVP